MNRTLPALLCAYRSQKDDYLYRYCVRRNSRYCKNKKPSCIDRMFEYGKMFQMASQETATGLIEKSHDCSPDKAVDGTIGTTRQSIDRLVKGHEEEWCESVKTEQREKFGADEW